MEREEFLHHSIMFAPLEEEKHRLQLHYSRGFSGLALGGKNISEGDSFSLTLSEGGQ